MKSSEWITYRTRFLVKAKQLSAALTFVDSLGRQHCGRKGDYLVESCDGVVSITPRQIFEDVYVPMFANSRFANSKLSNMEGPDARASQTARRKLPQPWRERRASSARLGVM